MKLNKKPFYLIFFVALVFPLSAEAIVTATPPPGGYTKPASSLPNGTSTTTNYNTGSGSGTSSSSTSSGSGGSGGSSGGSSASFQAGMGSMVQGSCNSVDGNIVNVNNLESFQSALVKVIQEVGKAVNTGQNQQMTADVQQRNQQLQEQTQNDKVMAANNAEKNYSNDVSGINSSGCTEANGAADTMNGIVSAQATAAQVAASALSAEKPVSNPLQNVTALAAATAPEVSSASLIPLGDATAATASDISAYIKNAVVPYNPQAITATAKSTASGAQYQAVSHIAQTRASLPTVTLAAIAKYNLPKTKDTLAQSLWQKAGESGTPPGVVNGKISDNDLLRVITDSRYASGAYANEISGGTGNTGGDLWNLRQYTIEVAAQLRMELQEQNMLEHTLALQSAMLATQLQHKMSGMNNLRGNAMEQVMNQPASTSNTAPAS